ncbi:thioesterase family protein [Sphingomonas gilva]|uniref:Thioesterase family protein n=1 Tax=Sphingomonas gilva TaxID=2305907 RepID=A0A396RJF7_9SPHN|nr:thioesterase family protein [Sphingomonas gilva]RHW16278.1 thioesterase family protein [Sphingomonas gilva]
MTSLPEILAAATPMENGLRMEIPASWMQGRTAYGGVSSAMALHAAQQLTPDLPPLRSAQVSFVGPLAGGVDVTARLLRRGKNAAWVQADVTSEAGLGLAATFVFVRDMESKVAHKEAPAPDFPLPDPDTVTYKGPKDFFIHNFELVDDRSDARGKSEWLRWVRLDEREGLDPMVHLIAVADALPPAAFKLIGGPAPVSSMTWLCNLLTPEPRTRDGWWLLRAVSEYAANGCSSQTMAIWNADGEPIATQMQSVALFV